MSYTREEGKDKIIFVTEEDHQLPEEDQAEDEQPSGIILPNGEINWDCPCLGGMADGPCGEQFKSAFSCFIKSEEEEKGSECFSVFRVMYDCHRQFADRYPDSQANTYNKEDGESSSEAEQISSDAEKSRSSVEAEEDTSRGAETSQSSPVAPENTSQVDKEVPTSADTTIGSPHSDQKDRLSTPDVVENFSGDVTERSQTSSEPVKDVTH